MPVVLLPRRPAARMSVPAAVLNAVNDALAPLGAEVRRLPATPERILSAIADARNASER